MAPQRQIAVSALDRISTFWPDLISFLISFEFAQTWNCIHAVRCTVLVLQCTSLLQRLSLLNICSSPAPLREGMTQGKPTVLLFTFHPHSPLTHGCYPSELSTNQLSAHICPMSIVSLLFSVLESVRRKEWAVWGLNQAVISRTDCLFFHCLCPSDKQAWVLTYDPFN